MLPPALQGSRSQTLLYLNILLCGTTVLAQDNGSGDVSDGDPQKGNEGPEAGSVNLSKGALVAIGIAVGVAVILGITTAILFYLAKKRQWEVRATIRRTATRVAEVMTPRTANKKMTLPKAGRATRANLARFPEPDDDEDDDDERPIRKKNNHLDLEKGRKPRITAIHPDDVRPPPRAAEKNAPSTPGQKREKKRPGNIQVPKSEFEMESPKTPMVSKIFGRK